MARLSIQKVHVGEKDTNCYVVACAERKEAVVIDPGDDIKDVLAGVDVVLGKGYVDANRLAIIGGSGGPRWRARRTCASCAALRDTCAGNSRRRR